MRFFKIFIGNAFITFAYAMITVPKIILNGGVTSFSLIMQEITGVDIAVIVDIMTVLLILISWIFLGKKYFIGALFSSICYVSLFHVFHYIDWEVPASFEIALPLGALLVAIGYYFCISAAATGVSFDTVALILAKYDERFDIAITMAVINASVLLLGFVTYTLRAVICGLIFTFLQGFFLHYFLKWGDVKVETE